MKKFNVFLLVMIIIISIGCRPSSGSSNTEESDTSEISDKLILPNDYKTINTIMTNASCVGPEGAYSTEVHSSIDGYTYFNQEYDYLSESFEVVLPDRNSGFVIDNNSGKFDSLPFVAQEIVRSHEFHKMAFFPHLFFEEIEFAGIDKERKSEPRKYIGKDRFNRPVNLYTEDRIPSTIEEIELINPVDTSEVILIDYSIWVGEKEYGPIPERLRVIQDGRDTFYFSFNNILINDDSFEKIEIDME